MCSASVCWIRHHRAICEYTSNMLRWQMKCVCLAWICAIHCDNDGCILLPVCMWIKRAGIEAGICRHTSQSVTLFTQPLNLIVTSTTLSPSAPPLSVSVPRWFHSLCNHVLSPLHERLITIHSYQREASPRCWQIGRLNLYPTSEDTRVNRKDSLMLFILGHEHVYYLANKGDVSRCLIIYWNFIKGICLSDSPDQQR